MADRGESTKTNNQGVTFLSISQSIRVVHYGSPESIIVVVHGLGVSEMYLPACLRVSALTTFFNAHGRLPLELCC